jgi:hypothetical protein
MALQFSTREQFETPHWDLNHLFTAEAVKEIFPTLAQTKSENPILTAVGGL